MSYLRKLTPLLVFGLLLVNLSGCSRQPRQPAYLWIDAIANWEMISSPAVILEVCQQARRAGFTGLLVDVKPITGEVLYPSKVAPRMTEWKGAVSPGGFDYLNDFVRLGHENKLQVFAVVNVFTGGHRRFKKGIVYSNYPDWQAVAYTPDGLRPMSEVEGVEAVFLQPSRRTVQEHELAILDEIVRHYPVDGVVLNRVQYSGLETDFSESSRSAFQYFLGHKVEHWPQDVYTYQHGRRVAGPLYRDWLLFRASVIHDFVKEARDRVKAARPRALFGLYAGAWYPQTPTTGLNWASRKAPRISPWPDSSFRKTAVADLLDLLFSGLYYEHLEPQELPPGMPEELRGWYAIDSAADSVKNVVAGACPVYGGLLLSQFRQQPKKLERAVAICSAKLDGIMLFDLVYIEQFKWWKQIRTVLHKRGRS
ncbi:MAG: family 10 glycosylhydrolase [Calditrichaeota bacterium]|nr:family 10 glycosylhydrolase [Calditrichota bacterium]